MPRTTFIAVAVAATIPSAATFADGWVNFVNETSTRLVAVAGLGSADPEEKDFAYGDVDLDGDIDLIVVRKQPFTTPNGKRNVFFRNEAGVLVDRSVEFATAADDGGQGFLDITNDRDVALGDFNGDGWPDFVTCTTLNQSMPKTISHPRIYMNLGNDENGQWLGFRYEEARIPALPAAPNGCGIATGDLTGDGFPEIYLVDYLSNQEDRLLINDGTGYFSDETLARMTPTMIASGFGTSGFIGDINGDGVNDIAKTENGPFKTTYNKPSQEGFFDKHETVSIGAHYGMSAGELNNDGKIDFVLGNDASDRYLLNTGNGADGMANFESKTFSFEGGGGDDGIGNNSRIVDLNNDGFNDVLIGDVDVDIGGCGRRLHMYRNLGNVPSVTIQEQGTGGIPTNLLTGTHDVAVFDVDGDGWKDLVIGRCSGISVWRNVPPVGLIVTYPQGLPGYVVPDAPHSFLVHMVPSLGEITPGSPALHYVPSGGVEQVVPLAPAGADQYEATLPAMACTDSVSWWVTATVSPGPIAFADPPGAPAAGSYTSIAALGTEITFRDEFETPTQVWTVTNDPTLTGGAWEAVDPNGTAIAGQQAAPEDDAPGNEGVQCFVTQNGVAGGAAGSSDVDNGPTFLVSPMFDFAGEDALVSYAAWFVCDDADTIQADTLRAEISNDDGGTWTLIDEITGTGSAWEAQFFRVSDFVEPTAQIRFRFSTQDVPNNSTTEAGIDNFQIETVLCPTACPGDLDGNGVVDGADLGVLLGAWGTAAGDLTGDGTTDGADLGVLLGGWGACS